MNNNKLLKIEVESAGFNAGNFANIKVNDVKLKIHNKKNNDDRGLHFAVINPKNGRVLFS